MTKQICDYLQNHGATYTVQYEEVAPAGHLPEREDDRIPEDVECILVLGGDGTLLRAANQVMEREIPLLGINLGNLGFLVEVDPEEIEQALERLMSGAYEMDSRIMLYGKITRDGRKLAETRALNDIVMTRNGSLQIIHYDISVNQKFLNRFSADGMILATPTGSTGYNMSAGGPIIEPSARLLALTPICPHTLNTRSIVLSPDDKVTLEIINDREGALQEAEVSFDGSYRYPLVVGDKLEVRVSRKVTHMIRLKEQNFLEVLHKKMSE